MLGRPSGRLGVGPNLATRTKKAPSRWRITASALHNRAAFSATAFMTGFRSLGELEITRRMSAVAEEDLHGP